MADTLTNLSLMANFDRKTEKLKEELNSKEINTNILVDTIEASDLNDDGKITKEEIAANAKQFSQQIALLNILKSMTPAIAQIIEPMIEQSKQKLDALKLVNDNYDIFNGKDDTIDYVNIENIVKSSRKDGNIENFSETDLQELKRFSITRRSPEERVNLGLDLIEKNKDQISLKKNTEGTKSAVIGKELALEFFDRMQPDDGLDNKFGFQYIDQIIKTAQKEGKNEPAKIRQVAILEAIKEADLNGDKIVSKDEMNKTMEAQNGLVVKDASKVFPEQDSQNKSMLQQLLNLVFSFILMQMFNNGQRN